MPIVVDPSQGQAPPASVTVSPDGRLTLTVEPDGRGVLLEYDGTADAPAPTRVRFTRSDGEAVRSGDVALAPGGYAIAYDHEPPVGEPISYTATPVDTDTAPSEAGALVGQPVDSIGLEGLWIKNVDDPGQSIVGEVATWEDLEYTTRVSSAAVLGKARPVVTVDSVSSPQSTFTIRTRGREAFKTLAKLLGLPGYAEDTLPPVLLLDPHSLLMRPRAYAVVTSAIPSQEGPVQLEQWVWSLQYQTVSRPDPTDAPLRIPGRSYEDVGRIYTAYSDIPQSNASYVQLATGSA